MTTRAAVERVTNGTVELGLLPCAGGRLISVRLDGHEYLWQHRDYIGPDLELLSPRSSWPEPDGTMASWVNVGGSKTWPAPQGWNGSGEWPGPPDPILDSGAWHYRRWSELDSVIAELTSPYDDRTGLVVTRRFELRPGQPGFRQTTTFCNRSAREVSWSIWEVCQVPVAMDGSDRIEIGVASGAEMVPLVASWGALPMGTVKDHVRTIVPRHAVGKLGITDADGRVSYIDRDGSSMSLAFEPVPGATYPDGGCQVELWIQTALEEPLAEFGGLHPRHDLVELEILSPLTRLAPGERTQASIDWSFSVEASHQSLVAAVESTSPESGANRLAHLATGQSRA